MTWEYGLIGLIVGIIIGAFFMHFRNKKLREYCTVQYELKKTKEELTNYRQELTSHFTQSAELLDNIVRDYRQFYQYMVKSSNDLLQNLPDRKKSFPYPLTEEEADDYIPVQIPRDYSEDTSNLLDENVRHGTNK